MVSAYSSLFKILCKCLFSEVTVQAVTELDNKGANNQVEQSTWLLLYCLCLQHGLSPISTSF
ncbi:hypothetical protein AOY87_10190 [Escherichia coli]|nr:hypothetical protein AOY87_10190 [Escherichia coli]